jgi:hypothetical protein
MDTGFGEKLSSLSTLFGESLKDKNKQRKGYPFVCVYIYINLFSLIIYIGMWDGYVLNASIHAGCR